MNKSIRILIADDHPVVRAGLQGMLAGEADFEVVGQAANGREALELVKLLRPDVVLMDLRMPEMDGVMATSEILEWMPGVHVLVLTTYDSDSFILKAIEAGATGYLLKDASREELFRAVRATAQGKPALAPVVASRLMENLRAPEGTALSSRELEVVELLAKGGSNKEIAQHLHISQATVKTHLIHIYSKLGVDSRTAAVTAALERNLIRLDEIS